MNPISVFRVAAGLVSLACLFSTGPLLAADAAFDEIVVTARKRAESLQDTPVAVTAIQGDVLTQNVFADIADIQAQVPNLSIYGSRNQSGSITAFIRGVGQADPLWGVDPGVGLYLDDVYVARAQGGLLDVFDVERIEVLRGPQGTIYGKNTIGGAIKYVSRAPTDEFEARVSASAGNFGLGELKGQVSGPIVEGKLRGKASVAYLQRDGFGTNRFTGRDVTDKDTLAFRLSADWLPLDNLTIRVAYDRTEDDAEPRGYKRLEANPNCALFLITCPPLDNNFDTESGVDPRNGTTMQGVSLVIDWQLNDAWSIKSITAYRESESDNNIDFDTTPAPITDVFATYEDDQTSQEFQFIYDPDGRFNAVFGVYLFDGTAAGQVFNNFFNATFGGTGGDGVDTESFALFGEGNFDITDQLTLFAGLRYTEEKKTADVLNQLFTDDSFTEVVPGFTTDFTRSQTFDQTTPRVGLRYQINDDINVYASYSEGFKSGGFNVRANQAAIPPESGLDASEPFRPETIDTFEIGLKSTLFDDQVLLNAAYFNSDYEDIQVSTFTSFIDQNDEPQFFGAFLNAGNAEIRGVESEFTITPAAIEWLSLQGTANYLNARPTSFVDNDDDGVVDAQVITNAPRVTGALNALVTVPLAGGEVELTGGFSYRDLSLLTTDGGVFPPDSGIPLEPLVQESFTLYNASIAYVPASGRWRLALIGRNLSDEDYLLVGYNIPVVGVRTGSFGAPRQVIGTFQYNFGAL